MAGAENDNMPTDRGEPDSWTLVRQGFDEPSFTLQKHMPEIIVGRSHDCQIACAGMYQLGLGPTVVAPEFTQQRILGTVLFVCFF